MGTPAATADSSLRLEITDLEVAHGGNTLLRNVNLRVATGEIHVLAGASGSGKSSLLRCIIGQHRPQQGAINFLGKNLWQLPSSQREALFRQLGVVFQGAALFSDLTALQNVALPLQQHTTLPDDLIDVIALAHLAAVDMKKAAHLYPRQLSGGMQKRVGIARALALDPALVVCDEPSAGLDPYATRQLDELILQLRHTLQTSFLIVSHDVSSINHIADTVSFVGEGGILAQGPVRQVALTQHPIVECFFSDLAH